MATLRLECVADTYVDADYSTTNYGGSPTLKTSRREGDSVTGRVGVNRSALFQFGSLPQGITVRNATIHFYVSRVVEPSGVQFHAFERMLGLSEPFHEYSTNAENVPGGSDSSGGSSYTKEVDVSGIGWYSFPISSKALPGFISAATGRGVRFQSYARAFRDVDGDGFDETIGFNAWVEIHSRENTNKPYIEIAYTVQTPTPSNPVGTTVDAAKKVTFSWFGTPGQVKYELRWRIVGGSWSDIIAETTGSTIYELPADTLPAGANLEWQVRATDQSGEWSAWSSITRFYTGATVPKAPTLLYPISVTAMSTETIRFRWQHNQEFGGLEQKAFELQWRPLGADLWESIAETTANEFYDMPPNTLAMGDIEWRARTTNGIDEQGPYSEPQTFFAVAAPYAPPIAVTPEPRPLVRWTAEGQQMYQLRVLRGEEAVYETGDMPGSEAQHSVRKFLPAGEYTAQVRIRSAYGLWSTWGGADFAVDFQMPIPPKIVAVNTFRTALHLIVSYTTPRCILYRREAGTELFREIAVLSGDTEYKDYAVASGKRYEYLARAAEEDNRFADSGIASGVIKLHCLTIVPEANPEQVYLFRMRLTQEPTGEWEYGIGKTVRHYVGRRDPAVETDGTRTVAVTMTYGVPVGDIERVYALAEHASLICRDDLGMLLYAEIASVSATRSSRKLYEVSFTLRKIDHKEDGELA